MAAGCCTWCRRTWLTCPPMSRVPCRPNIRHVRGARSLAGEYEKVVAKITTKGGSIVGVKGGCATIKARMTCSIRRRYSKMPVPKPLWVRLADDCREAGLCGPCGFSARWN